MCGVLGMLLAVSLKTQLQVRAEGGTPKRLPQLVAAYKESKEANEKLQHQVADLQAKITEYQGQMGEGSSATRTLNKELQDVKFLAGNTPVEGEGVIVTLKDSRKKSQSMSRPATIEEVLDYIIHDSDIRNIVNELSVAGAEAISINGQRLIAMSPIRCVGSATLVNDVPVTAPFEITAIGNPKTMDNALRMPGGVVDQFSAYPEMIDIRQESKLVVPAFSASRHFDFARPATERQ